MSQQLLILENLKKSYIIDQENTMNEFNHKLNSFMVFQVNEDELKKLVDKLSVISISIQQVDYFIKTLKNDNSTESNNDNSNSG